MRVLALDLGPAPHPATGLLTSALAGRGHTVTLVVLRPGAEAAGRPAPAAASPGGIASPTAGVDGSRVERLDVRPGSESSPGLLLGVAGAAHHARPDVIWACDPRGHGAAVWSRVASSRPLVVHRRHPLAPRSHLLSRLKYHAADRFLVGSRATAATLSRIGVPVDRVHVLPDPLPDEAYVEREPPRPPPLRLLHASRAGHRIAVEVLSRLSARGWDLTLTLLTESDDGHERLRLEQDLEVRSRCELAPVSDLPGQLASYHALLLPSPLPEAPELIAAAFAAGCPVLALDSPWCREALRDGDDGRLVPSLDPAAWTEAVVRLIGSPKDRAHFVEAGRARAAERTVGRIASRLEAALREAVGARAQPSSRHTEPGGAP